MSVLKAYNTTTQQWEPVTVKDETAGYQAYDGTFATDESGQASVDCGFQPDLVILSETNLQEIYETDMETPVSVTGGALPFYAMPSGSVNGAYCNICVFYNNPGYTPTHGMAEVYGYQATSGFTIKAYWLAWNWNYNSMLRNHTFTYRAVKFS